MLVSVESKIVFHVATCRATYSKINNLAHEGIPLTDVVFFLVSFVYLFPSFQVPRHFLFSGE